MSKIYKEGSELTLQRNLVKWFRLQYPKQQKHLIRIGNEGKKSPVTGKIDKQTGLVVGASDLFLAIPSNGFAGLWLELKREGAKITPSNKEHHDRQISFLNCMREVGYAGYMVWGFDEAKDAIQQYLKKEEKSSIITLN